MTDEAHGDHRGGHAGCRLGPRVGGLRLGHQDRTEHQHVGNHDQHTTTSAKAAPTTTAKVAPREEDAAGPNPTIASYITENNIQETPVNQGDPGAPTIDLPIPPGWEPAGENTPDWAYGAIIYSGPEAAEYSPSIVALLSKLTGNVDPQQIIDLAPGELQNLPGWSASNEGQNSTLGEYPAYQLGGTWESDGQTKIVAQKTVVIPGATDSMYCSSTPTAWRIRTTSSTPQPKSSTNRRRSRRNSGTRRRQSALRFGGVCRGGLGLPDTVEPFRGLVETRDQLGDDVCDGPDFVHPADDLADRHRDGIGIVRLVHPLMGLADEDVLQRHR